MSLDTYGEYTRLVFFLLADRSTVAGHTLAVFTVNRTGGITRGEVIFRSGHVLRVFEQLDFVAHRILKYSYELTFQGETLWWYDSMPHPTVPELQSTHPHHKHVPPDIKHQRIPAPEMSFTRPNLPFLIELIEQPSSTS
ncbi:MAG: hypothetical protein CVU38_12475 [Chloroflexi bacterium HGW-Chloroflexi-1]|nr:MAG: hypothetical protein CVU38_12475 [Chloroflexi bacterium HGW-Chloroflexi-1]